MGPLASHFGDGRMIRMTNIPQAMESPVPLREFVVSPGFAGAAAVVAAHRVVRCALRGPTGWQEAH